ncbi:MAG: hypothetical protein JO312_01890 [Hyphomicrobiales bacterium]|nr:hypothetical protein [Hyphomicrobiales bacterium]
MTGLIVSHVFYGLDSFIFCLGLGPFCRSRRSWLFMASAFGVADGVGALLGSQLIALWPDCSLASAIGAPAVAAYGFLVLIATARVRSIVTSRISLACLPILFSLDNLAAAASTGHTPAGAEVAATTITTASLAFLGCGLGTALIRGRPALRGALPGGAAIVAAAIMIVS